MIKKKIKVATLTKKSLEKQGFCRLKVKGSSMFPTLLDGDIIEITSQKFSSLLPGQIIAFSKAEEIIVHRIKYKTPLGYITVGDNNILLDEGITRNNYLGIVSLKVNEDGSMEPLQKVAHPKSKKVKKRVVVYIKNNSIKTPFFQSPKFQVMDLDKYVQAKNNVAFGISPFGIMSEDEFIEHCDDLDEIELVCMANFGPEREPGLFPVTQVQGVVRLNYFNYWHSSIPNVHQRLESLLCYLDGLFAGINYSKKEI